MKTTPNKSSMLQRVMLIIGIFFTTLINAQTYPVQVTPQLIPPYSLKISDYATLTNEKLYVNILLTDVNEIGRRVRLKMYIEGQGLSISSHDMVRGAAPIFVDGGINLRLSNLDLQPYFELNNLLGITPQQYNNPLPNGGYNFCFEVYDYFTNRLLSAKSCTTVFLLQNDPPILNLPFRDNIVTATNPQNILFTWTPRHSNVSNVQYEFTLKEIWDVQNPQANFLASVPFYQTTTYNPTLLVGPDAPQLLSGKIYGWQVRAFVSDGIDETSVFKNDGRSEIFWFKYLQDCAAPTFVISQALTAESVQINWQISEHLRYRIQYRKKGYGDDDWFEVNSYTNEGKIYNLEADTTYEFRVGGECTQLSGFAYSNIQEFTTPTNDETAYYNCGLTPEINITNQEPLPKLGVNETFTAGDFPVVTREVTGSNGTFSGWGYITLPFLENIKEIIDAVNIASQYLGNNNEEEDKDKKGLKLTDIGKYTRIKVKFNNVSVNSSYQLTQGVVVTEYDAEWSNILDVDNLLDDVFGDDGGIQGFDGSNTDIKDITVDENGTIIVHPENGEPFPIDVQVPTVITDSEGQQWTVDEDGKVSGPTKQADGGVPDKSNTEGISGSGTNNSVKQISSKDVEVTFARSGYYSTDLHNESISSSKYKKQYEFIKKHNDSQYSVLYKLISDIPEHEEDEIKANVTFANGKSKKDVIFKTLQGAKVETSWPNDNTAILKLKRKFVFGKEEIVATVKPKDSTGKYTVAGKLNLWHAQQRNINLTLVSVDGAPIDNVGKRINEIYNKAGIEFTISKEAIELNIKDLDVGDSDMLSHYTEGEKNIIAAFKKAPEISVKKDQYYIFFLKNSVKLTKELNGFMPLKRQFGFVFKEDDAGRIAAHEIGHGIFGLKHPWDQYETTKGASTYLMDSGNTGTDFSHMDWQKLHAPGIQLYWFQGDEDGESVSTSLDVSLAVNKTKYKCENGNCVKTNKGKYYFGYLTPSGKRITLSEDYLPIFYHGISNDKYTHIVPGTLIGFKKKVEGQKESLKYWSILSSNGEKFSGYNNDFKYEVNLLEEDDNSIVIGLPFGGSPNDASKWKNYKFLLEGLKAHKQEEQDILKVTSNEFQNIGLFADSSPTEIKSYSNISKIIGEEQISVTDSELKILRGRYFEIPNIADFTTLIQGITTIRHDEKPEVFLLVKIAEIQNRYPFLFEKYSKWFDQWNVYALTQENYLSVNANIIAKIVGFNKGEWERDNVTKDLINNNLSNYRKWKDNLSTHNTSLYNFYKSFTADLRDYTDTRSESNFECLSSLKSKTAKEIFECVELASNDELKQISQENRHEALRIIALEGNTSDYLRDREETVVQRLIKYVPSNFNSDVFIDYLTNTIIPLYTVSQYGTVTNFNTPLWQVLFDKIDDSKFLYSGDNRNAIMLQLLKHYYGSLLYEVDVQNIVLDYQEKLLGQPISAIKALNEQLYTFTNDYQNILRRGFTHFKGATSPGGMFSDPDDLYFSIDAEIKGINKIHLKQQLKWGFTSNTVHEGDFGPFDLSLMMNLSKETLLSGFSLKNSKGKPQSVPLPAIILYYASEVGNEQTKSDIIQSAIDIATLPIPAANLTKLGKVFYYADKISSVSSLLATGNRENNPELTKFYNRLSLVTGVTSIGDMLTPNKLLKEVISAENLAKSAENILDDVIKFTDEIENLPIDKLNAIEIGAGRRILEGNLEEFKALNIIDDVKKTKIVNAINKLKNGLDFDASKHLVVLGNDIDLKILADFENKNVDGVLDLVIHGNAERFVIDGSYVDNITDIANWLKTNKPDVKEIRLLSCTNIDGAQNLVDHLGDGYKVYATDGFVRIHSGGGVSTLPRGPDGSTDWYELGKNVERKKMSKENYEEFLPPPKATSEEGLSEILSDFVELSNRSKRKTIIASLEEGYYGENILKKFEKESDKEAFIDDLLILNKKHGISKLNLLGNNLKKLDEKIVEAWLRAKDYPTLRMDYKVLKGLSESNGIDDFIEVVLKRSSVALLESRLRLFNLDKCADAVKHRKAVFNNTLKLLDNGDSEIGSFEELIELYSFTRNGKEFVKKSSENWAVYFRSSLEKGVNFNGFEAHHIFPVELFQRKSFYTWYENYGNALYSYNATNDIENLIMTEKFLTEPKSKVSGVHANHPNYSDHIGRYFDELFSDLKVKFDFNDNEQLIEAMEVFHDKLQELRYNIKQEIINKSIKGDTKIDDLWNNDNFSNVIPK